MCPAFLFMDEIFDKPFKTVKEQIEILKSRNLIIPDEEKATTELRLKSYYKLINGYQNPFWAQTDYFQTGTTIYHILLLYAFDELMRCELLNRFLSLESKLKTIIAYEYCKVYGALGYKDKANYGVSATDSKLNDFIKVVDNIKTEALSDVANENDLSAKNRNTTPQKTFKYKPVGHYIQNHHDVPLWVMMECLTLGNVSVFFELIPVDVKKAIADKISHISKEQYSYKDIKIMLKTLTILRNTCAHSNPLYNFKMKNNISSNSFVKRVKSEYGDLNTNNLAAGFIILSAFLPEKDVINSFDIIKTNFESCKKSYSDRANAKIMDSMGFDLIKLLDILENNIKPVISYE